jgi:hypothetical protein
MIVVLEPVAGEALVTEVPPFGGCSQSRLAANACARANFPQPALPNEQQGVRQAFRVATGGPARFQDGSSITFINKLIERFPQVICEYLQCFDGINHHGFEQGIQCQRSR